MEKRMYFFVPYQLTGIQQGIQAGHAALEYANRFHNSELFQDFIINWKTWVILNGGTTNRSREDEGVRKGSLDQIYSSILDYNVNARLDDKIDVEKFFEPDLNDAMTAVCFIVDEQVFNRDLYPDFKDSGFDDKLSFDGRTKFRSIKYNYKLLKEEFPGYHDEWEKSIGGPRNAFLKDLLNGKKLA